MTNLLEQLLDAQQKQATLLGFVQNDNQQIAVYQHRNWRWIYTGGNSIQSTLNLDAPRQLQQAYQAVMLTALLFNPIPKRVLNLGFGGGTFERFFADMAAELTTDITALDLHNEAGKIELVSLDINEQLVILARQHMAIPPQWPVIIESAEGYLANSDDLFELIICDVFEGESHVSCLEEESFYLDAARRLTNNGVMAINLAPTSEQALIDILRITREIFACVMVSKVEGCSNIVLLVSKQSLPNLTQLESQIEPCLALWPLDFATLLNGFKLLPG